MIDLKIKSVFLVVSLFLFGCSSGTYYEKEYTLADFHKLVVGKKWQADEGTLPDNSRQLSNVQFQYVPTDKEGEYKRVSFINNKEMRKQPIVKIIEYRNLDEKYKKERNEGKSFNFAIVMKRTGSPYALLNIVDGELFEFYKNSNAGTPPTEYSVVES